MSAIKEMKTFESRMRELVHTEMTSESPDGNGGSLQITETTIPMHSVADALDIAQEADAAILELQKELSMTKRAYMKLYRSSGGLE